MQITSIQMFVFVQSLVTKIKFPDMELTKMAVPFRNQYKAARGLPKRMKTIDLLKDVKQVCEENNMMDEFNRATAKYPEILAQL